MHTNYTPSTLNLEHQTWSESSGRLAKFVCKNMVNRTDAYGRYRSLDDRENGSARTVRNDVTEELVKQHFCATDRSDLIGLHTTSPNNTCRWLAIDIDHHGDADSGIESLNEKAALELFEMLAEFGSEPLLLKSNGRGGYHIWVIFDEPVAAELVYRFGNSIVEHWQELGLKERPEVFPKQPTLTDDQLGNWVRLPGLHHTYDFYTEVGDGESWSSGQQAIDRICSTELFPAELIASGEFDVVPVADEVESAATADDESKSPIERVLSRLKGVLRSGAGYVALCPNHHDTEQSLSIGEDEDGKVLINCFVCPEREEIVKAIGLEWKDLFADKPNGMDRELRHRHARVGNNDKSSQLNLEALHQSALAKTTTKKFEELAYTLGVSVKSLQELEVAWSEPDGCWLFPERDHQKRIIGLLRRFPDGKKRNVSGGKRGLYIPKRLTKN